jgi:hypothetical protein
MTRRSFLVGGTAFDARAGLFVSAKMSGGKYSARLMALVCYSSISYGLAGRLKNIEEFSMVRAGVIFWLAILCGLFSLCANAANDDQAAALKKATAECRAQVKDYAKYNETSWYGRRRMIKKCVKGMPWRKE